jgi:uncharacterized membrane protein
MRRLSGVRPTDAHLPIASTQELGESPVWPTLAVLTAAGLYATLPSRFIVGSGSSAFGALRWVVPALTVLLLAPLARCRQRERRLLRSPERLRGTNVALTRRVVSIVIIALVTVANAVSIVLLVHLLVQGAHTHANLLLRAGIHMWITNVLVFALWFWQLDAGGPLARRLGSGTQPDLLFPQQTFEPPSTWQPSFIDYLYVAFTNSTAFSPTDAMPLTNWAKTLMMVQSSASLLLAIMVVARAVNILH